MNMKMVAHLKLGLIQKVFFLFCSLMKIALIKLVSTSAMWIINLDFFIPILSVT